ncbi:centrosomal protein of 295 kDa isoform X1 [Rhinolophus sinicus]|uniref:centrosomal protein of 295 kDa isoform X1 n=1 Tax=Rhinolophus sinicus TaxID=89399 RepID=UPI003D78F36F
MKRKVINAGKLRLSPNEEAFVLKEDYERRRKLRLLQVREQERGIALQIREDIKQRRNQQFIRLAEALRTEWEESQTQKIKNLEKLYLASLRNMGEGHQQAKENEPDLNALAQRAAERKRKAEMRHKEALKVQKNKKEMLMKQKTWHIKARKEALLVEKERSAKITSLPPPPPTLFENIEVKRISNVKTSNSTYHHLHTFVNREVDTKQPDPHLAAEEEAKRLEEIQKQAAKERMEQNEKAHVRGFQAMKKIHLAQNQEKLMQELKQLQQEDLARRRQTVARMPPQLLELPYKRSEMKEDWQRELEFAFEDMYNADNKVKGNLILHLEPEPLPTVTDQIQDEELDLSMEQENLGETENLPVTICSSEANVPLAMKTHQLPSKILFKKLLNKIRSQKSLWTIKSMSEDDSEMITTVSETESKAPTVESETTTIEERTLSEQEQVVTVESDTLTVDSGPLTSEDKPLSCDTDSEKEKEMKETQPITAVAQSSVLLHPQEEAARIRMAARQKQIMEIEEQKQKQLELLEQIAQQKLRLETDCFRVQLEEAKRKNTQQTGVGTASASYTTSTDEDGHRRMIHNYQYHLLQQNRFHRQSVETARKRLLEYQTMLRGKYPSTSATSLLPDSVTSAPPERPTIIPDHWDQGQRPKLSLNKCQPIQPIQIPKLEQDYFQLPRQNLIPRRPVETTETDVLAKQCSEPQEQPKQFSQIEAQQRDCKSVPKESPILSRALSDDRPLTLQHSGEIAETSRAMTFQALDSQQMSENNENTSSKLAEPSFLPLVTERSFSSSLPAKVESGKIQERFSTMNKSAVSVSHSKISQMQDKSLPPSENVMAQQGHLKALQEQLDLQKEVLQSRQEAQEQLLLCKQKELERQTGVSVFLPSVHLDSFASLPSAKAQSGRIWESSPAKNDTAVSSGHPGVPQLQDRLSSFSQPVLSQQDHFKFLQQQLNVQRDSLQARREAQEVLHVNKQGELDGGMWSEQTEPPSLPSQVTQHAFTSLLSAGAQSGKIQEQYSSKSGEGLLSSQPEIPKSQDGSLSFLQQFLPLHNSLKLLQEQLTAQKDALQARHEAQVELLLHRHRDLADGKSGHMSSSFPPTVAQHSVALQAPAKTESRFQNLCLSKKEGTVPSSHLIIPTFRDDSPSFRQHSLPQQEHLSTLQEESHIQRVTHGAKQETREFVHQQSELERVSGQTGTSLSLPQVDESEGCQEFMSIKSDSTVSLSHSKIPRFQDRVLRFSQQGNLGTHQEWLDTEKEALHCNRITQRSTSSEQTASSSFTPQLGPLSFTSLPSPESGTTQEPLSTESDGKIPSSHFQIPQLQDRLLRISQLIQPQQDNLKALQERLATQREAIVQSRQEAQEELLLHKQSEWEEGIFPEQADTSSFLPLSVQHSFASLPCTESDRIQEPCPTKSDNTAPSSHSEISGLPDRLLGLSQLPQQDHLTAQLHLQREVVHSSEKTQEELLLNQKNKLIESESSEHAVPFLFPPKGREHFLIPLPFAEVESKYICELDSFKNEHIVSSSDSVIPKVQDRLLSFSQPILAQQDNLGFQKQLDLQKEALHYSQKAQEELQVQRQTALQQQIQQHQETLKDFFKDSQFLTSKPTLENDLKTQMLRDGLPHLQDQARDDRENIRPADRSNSDDNQLLSEDSSKINGENQNKELGRRASKPPVAKVKCGLDLNQHELSAIQEVESPASGRPSVLGKPDFYQDRDPLRVSISREHSFLGTPLDHDPFGCPFPIAQENVCGDVCGADSDEAVKVKEAVVENHAVLSYAVEEEHTYLSPAVKPDTKAEMQKIYHEPLSSITISTGSLSYENTDLSFTDPVDLDFPELEHSFPNFHHQLFKPLEPQPDFDFSSFSSGISQESRDFYQSSDSSCESHHATVSYKSTAAFTALRSSSLRSPLNTSLNQQPDPNVAQTAAQSFATGSIGEGSEQSFQQLLPEFSSQEGSQHADLPSIFSIEARDSSQGIENQNYSSEQTEILQNKKKSVHFQPSVGTLQSSIFISSHEANVFHQLNLQHSTPCGSTSSECSVKDQPEGRKERLAFEELSEREADTVLQSQGLLEDNKNEICGVLNVNAHTEETDSQLHVGTEEMGTSTQTLCSLTLQNEKYENSTKTETPKIIRNLPQLSQSELFSSSGSFSLQSSIPVWETESGHGIMEEPELTLVSTSDISMAEMDFANLTLEEKEENQAKSFQVSEFMPLVPETETSDYPAVSEHSVEKPTTLSTEMLPKFTPVPGSLQEAFVKRKKSFIERSSQRQKEIRSKIRVSEYSQSKIIKGKSSPGSSVSPLKGMNRVSLPEDRKTAQALRHQKALRFYNQLAEVKQQREEKAKQAAYAQNRARAKEFHKKTLEKLRAKNTC